MHSMDDVFERMQHFARVLGDFQEALQASVSDLDRQHAAVDPLWRDERRRTYDAEFEPLRAALVRYVQQQGPAYLDFLDEKLRAIDQYLRG